MIVNGIARCAFAHAMASELEYLIRRCPDRLDAKAEFHAKRAIKNARELIAAAQEQDKSDDPGIAEHINLMDAISDATAALDAYLQDFAPPYAYFGSHPGDGADIGFWMSECFDDDFDGLRVADTSEVPDDYEGEVLHINDHGNMTLYFASEGALTEVWSLV